ncbi:MAG: hypothetical protein A3H28_08970 [Acidobacteria bacterium RIFCSPLOWO2_02_FULL_61_28]|nr:MAG: hypothetical protein A3H28_08970 [Acidobacteria bacterium RIFCSPLOWO2_02_FULL_61_28]
MQGMQVHDGTLSDREANLLRSMTQITWKFYLWITVLFSVALWGLYAYVTQLREGMIVTGLRDQIFWGLYITNFVFFVGISHAGTLISAILRVCRAQWSHPITRLAEGITVFALLIGAPMVIIDLGRPDRMLNLFRFGRIQSPILWDVICVSTYLTGCILYFFIPMIPDLALLATRNELPRWRRRFYKSLTLGWTGSPGQWHLLERSISIMAIFIIPLAISVHTVVSWIFVMTLRPGWNTTIFGPYFVTGAIYSGIGAVIVSMFFLRRVFRFGDYIQELHFRNLGILLLSLSLLFLYFNVNEYMAVGYKFGGHEKALLDRLFVGEFATLFRIMLGLTTLGPTVLLIAVLGIKRWRHFTIPGTVLAATFVVVGAWLERYLIVVPTLSSPFLPAQGLPPEWMNYRASWVEWSIIAAAFATFLLIYTFLSKLFPMVSIWETRGKEAPMVERIEERAERAVPAMRPQPYMPPPLAMALIGTLLVAAISARAQQPTAAEEKGKATVLELEWEPLPPAEPTAASAETAGNPQGEGSNRAYFFAYQFLSPLFSGGGAARSEAEERPVRPLAITAKLRDTNGVPLSYQAVGFALETSFGTLLQFSKVPTDSEGRARLVLRDRRCGTYPFQATFGGDQQTLRKSYALAKVDFGPCPAPALPASGVLITPYATAPITLAFVFFYGTMWVVFFYAFGYLLVWRMRREGRGGEGLGPQHGLETGPGN